MKQTTSQATAVPEFKPISVQREPEPWGARVVCSACCWTFICSPARDSCYHIALEYTARCLISAPGEMPFRGLLPAGLYIPQADGFGMRRHPDIEDSDGLHIPFAQMPDLTTSSAPRSWRTPKIQWRWSPDLLGYDFHARKA
jgi:hypothetical protein